MTTRRPPALGPPLPSVLRPHPTVNNVRSVLVLGPLRRPRAPRLPEYALHGSVHAPRPTGACVPIPRTSCTTSPDPTPNDVTAEPPLQTSPLTTHNPHHPRTLPNPMHCYRLHYVLATIYARGLTSGFHASDLGPCVEYVMKRPRVPVLQVSVASLVLWSMGVAI